MTDHQRRQGYCRMWLKAYHGTHPLFASVKQAAASNPGWEMPPSVVLAVVRFSADEIWKPDPALEIAVRKQIDGLRTDPCLGGVVLSEIATTVTERNRVRAQARAGYARTSRRRRH